MIAAAHQQKAGIPLLRFHKKLLAPRVRTEKILELFYVSEVLKSYFINPASAVVAITSTAGATDAATDAV